MDLEVVHVIGEPLDADALHPLLHAPHQARAFVGREIEPARASQVVEQRLEIPGFLRLAHATVLASAVSAGPISPSGRTYSTAPVSIAACGIPK